MSKLFGVFIGHGRLLITCADLWRGAGHHIVRVVSDCPDVSAWANAKGVSRVSPQDHLADALANEPFDYLFSIVNHTITPADALALPRHGAINYHDSLLPHYAGFNATSWAILDGQTEHGVTWHEMSADVDGGPIVLRQPIAIQPDDTAYTLGAKCVQAGADSFPTLIERLQQAVVTGHPLAASAAEPGQDFHLRSDRPGLGVIDPRQSAATIQALVRGLDLGSDDNWMCRPKLATPAGLFIVNEATVGPVSTAPVGSITAISADRLEIRVADAIVHLAGFTTLEGAPVNTAALDLQVGQVLACEAPEMAQTAAGLDAGFSKHERFWVRRLASAQGPVLADLRGHPTSLDARLLLGASPSVQPPTDDRRAPVIAAFAAYLARVGENATVDLALHKARPVQLAQAYAATAPLRVNVDLAASFGDLLGVVTEELKTQDRRGGYARDIVTRYRALRGRAADLTIGVRFAAINDLAPADALDGRPLTLVVAPDGAYAWAYNSAAITDAAMARLAARVATLLASGLAEVAAIVGTLDMLPQAERSLLLTEWQDTAAPYAQDLCVHELFEQQVERTPDATAVMFQGQSLTYRQLHQRANTVAQALIARGVGPDGLVAVCIERSIDMVVGLMGVLKAGGAYVPLDPAYPRERLSVMLEDCHAKVVLTQRALAARLPAHGADVVSIDDLAGVVEQAPRTGVTPDNLAYVIFTSGSTGRPKGVMVQHGNVANFFAGMDATLGTDPGVWLAVTSISFDISVLELFWTLTRGFEVVIQAESDRASLTKDAVKVSADPMAFGLFYFAADQGAAKGANPYRLLLEGAKFADTHDFSAVWTPERHFHAFGGLYPNPAVTTAALATITSRVALRAGSVVLPLHNPLRVAEDWSVIDQLSGGRVGLSFASGWHADDFAFMPENYERRREIMLESIDTVLKLWRGEKVEVQNGQGKSISVGVLPRPIQAAPPMWIASAGSVDTFKLAGKLGANVLTNMLGQDLADLKEKFAAYRQARADAGYQGPGNISVMLHTFVCEDTETARELARKPFCDYLSSSFDLIKVAPSMFPAFRQPSLDAGEAAAFDASRFTDEDMGALMKHAFDRYFETAGLFGSPEKALGMIERLKGIGANEVACLIDFGIDPDVVLQSLPHLDRLRQLANSGTDAVADITGFSIPEQIRDRAVTHLQCTPSMARMLSSDTDTLASLSGLQHLLLGGEALPTDLAQSLTGAIAGKIHNMYGPTETTIWSTTAPVQANAPITIGRPIANTTIRILDARHQLAPIGAPGELCIGGAGVVRGYLGRPDLTAERFVSDPYDPGQTLYRTGDLARWNETGEIEFLGRLDHQVKVNGYRIELGEIETVLGRHPGVRQGVVVARADDGPARLVGYIVPAGQGAAASDDGDRVAQWQGLWDETYKQAGPLADPRFNIAGWNDSATTAPIPANEMREWLDGVERSVMALRPERVLEIGCGTGMVLYRVAPQVSHYTAVDLSAHALETIRQELTAAEAAKVVLLQQPAHVLDGLANRSFDTVIINSVAQYFPDADYLVQVLKRASELVADGGRIFVGDVRSRDHLDAFHTLVALAQAPGDLDSAELRRRIDKRVAEDGELVLSQAFFHAVRRAVPRLAAADVRLKPEAAHNEMSRFRFDAVLHVGENAPAAHVPLVAATADIQSLDAVRSALAATPPILVLANLKNARLAGACTVRDALSSAAAPKADALRQTLMTAPSDGVDPQALADLHPDYVVDIMWAQSGDPARFDAVLRHRTLGPQGRLGLGEPQSDAPLTSYANQPFRVGDDEDALFNELRAHLRESLPEYMTPAVFVALDALPLTPNGKIDRNALPAPVRQSRQAKADFVPPSNALEETIAGIWKSLLKLDQVGLRDNIFDLGANSLLTAQANQRLSAALDRRVSLVSMFRFPTVEALAAHLSADGSNPPPTPPLAPSARKLDAAARRRELRAAQT